MKVTLYEALGVAPTATQAEVRAALRGLVRQYYGGTREDQVEIEEALRFINHASHILSDPARRARYDQEIATGVHINDGAARRDYVASMNALGVGRTTTALSSNAQPEFSADLVNVTGQEPRHFGLAASIARVSNNVPVQIIFGLCLIPLLLLLLWVVTPPNSFAHQAKLMLFWSAVTCLIAAGVYILVHLLMPRRRAEPVPELPPALAQITILKWRREKTVFLGANEPVEDQTWLFRLRMAELERAKNRRTSEPHSWLRFWARTFDYALWGLALWGVLRAMVSSGWVAPALAATLAHPLLAPILITTTWVPVEVLLQVFLQTTPGKWLFAIYVQYGVSDVYASDDWHARWRTCARRALLVWWRGAACGLPLLSLIFMAVAKEKLVKKNETVWDAREDCLVTQGTIGAVNAVTATLSLIAFVWIYGNAWADPLRATTGEAGTIVQQGGEWWQRLNLAIPNLDLRRQRPRLDVAAEDSASQGPSPLEIKRRRWAEYQQEADKMGTAKDWPGQTRVCKTWADEDYKNPAAWRCLGLAHQALGQHKQAVEALQKAAKLDPNDAQVQDALVRSFRAQYQR